MAKRSDGTEIEFSPVGQRDGGPPLEPRRSLPGIVRIYGFMTLSKAGDPYLSEIDNGHMLDAASGFALAKKRWVPRQVIAILLIALFTYGCRIGDIGLLVSMFLGATAGILSIFYLMRSSR